MEKNILFPIAILLTIILTGCSSNSVKKNAMGYIKATSEYDMEGAKQYATSETQAQTLDIIQQRIIPNLPDGYIEANKPEELRIDSILTLSDTEAVVYYFKKTHLTQYNGTLDMRLRDGEWKAHILMDLTNPFIAVSLDKRPESSLPNRDSIGSSGIQLLPQK